MEQRELINVSNCLNTNIYSYLETSGGQSSNIYLNVERLCALNDTLFAANVSILYPFHACKWLIIHILENFVVIVFVGLSF